jgi:hypothetical protein
MSSKHPYIPFIDDPAVAEQMPDHMPYFSGDVLAEVADRSAAEKAKRAATVEGSGPEPENTPNPEKIDYLARAQQMARFFPIFTGRVLAAISHQIAAAEKAKSVAAGDADDQRPSGGGVRSPDRQEPPGESEG